MNKFTEQDGQSVNIIDENIAALQTIFPEAFTEGKVDFDVLHQLLGNAVDDGEEKYGLTWFGKKQARQIALTPSLGTLRPCPEESVDWETTQNLFIEGDNLEVLKLLQKSYAGKVKMIYIDPPYNTGNEFIYPDRFQENLETYLRYTGQKDNEEMIFSSNTETSGRYHTNWLNMMYPRLKLARSLLRKDGVIFISIDDNEQANLKKLCDELFGIENFIGCITRVSKTTSFRGNFIAPGKDYLLCYAKNVSETERFIAEVDESQFKKTELSGPRKGERYRDDIAFYLSTLQTRPNQRYFIECPDGTKVLPPGSTFPPEKPKDGDGVWRWNLDSFNEKKDLIVFKETKTSPLIDSEGNRANWNLYTKSYLSEKLEKGNLPRDLWTGFLNRNGSSELKKLDIPFDFPKPTSLIINMMKIIQCRSDDIVLDFFAGSATTAHAAMRYNFKTTGDIKFIMVQLPEICEEKSSGAKAGYKTIADIGKERIRRAATKIKRKNPEYYGDLGFKVFKLDSSNIRAWNPDRSNLAQTLLDHKEHLVPDRSEQDVLYELLLKRGIELTVPMEAKTIAGKTVYSIGYGALFACLNETIARSDVEELAHGILAWHKKLVPASDTQIVFRDSAFADDIAKTNMAAILEQNGISHVRSL